VGGGVLYAGIEGPAEMNESRKTRRPSVKYPKIAGTASPRGSGDLKDPSFPPVAQGHSPRDLGGYHSVAATGTTFPHIPIVRLRGGSFQGKIRDFRIP
jgi:hypothetical protein